MASRVEGKLGLVRHVSARVALLVAVAAFTCGQRCSNDAPPRPDLAGLRGMLEKSSETEDADEIAWEPSGGWLTDVIWGRRVLFTAAQRPKAATSAAKSGSASKQACCLRDVYRARVRVSYEGAPLSVMGLNNLTQTPLGQESQLQVNGSRAAFAATAYDMLQGVTVLELGGRAPGEQGSLASRLLGVIRNWQRTGSLAGIARTHLALPGVEHVRVDLEPEKLLLTEPGKPAIALDLDKLSGVGEVGPVHYSAHAPSQEYWLHILVQVLRTQVGSGWVSWLESRFFAVQDGLVSASAELREAPPKPAPEGLQAERGQWPPRDITPMLAGARQGEGHWVVPSLPWESQHRSGSAFRQTFIHPDAKRPRAKLMLVAMDMRRLELRMQAGYEEPAPKTGPPGSGALPKDPALLKRVRATFNGGFRSAHGDYGMMVDGRVLVPPTPHAASVVVSEDGRTALGDWPDSAEVPPGIKSFRQNLDPLIANGELNPHGREQWGTGLLGRRVVTQRSALCLAESGHLYYAWGDYLTADALAAGLKHAGCSYAMHLDMNPGHCAFFYDSITGTARGDFHAVPAWPEFTMSPARYALWSAKDFFYVVDADGTPSGDVSWQPSPGLQPEPRELPGIYTANTQLGALELSLYRVSANRLKWHLVAGTDEPLIAGRPAPLRELPSSAGAPLIAINLGRTTTALRLGLAFQFEETLPMRSAYATLTVSPAGLQLVAAGQIAQLDKVDGAVQLPVLVEAGQLLPKAIQTGERRKRGALCLESDGSVLLATALHDSNDVLALALRDQGCADVVELDRGSKHDSFVARAGTQESPKRSYPTTVLIGVSQPMPPRTFTWR